MTENKRFIINNDMSLDDKVETYELSCIVDNDNKTFYFVVGSIANVELFVERLNTLSEENEQLKQQLRIFEEGLKSEIKETKIAMDDWNECLTDCRKLEKENEQLKEQMQTILKLTKKIEDCTHDIKMIGDVE